MEINGQELTFRFSWQSWTEQRKSLTSKRKVELSKLINARNKRRRLPNTVTIDSIHEKNFLSPKSVLEAVVIDVFTLPGMLVHSCYTSML
jgi:hypothetical protein